MGTGPLRPLAYERGVVGVERPAGEVPRHQPRRVRDRRCRWRSARHRRRVRPLRRRCVMTAPLSREQAAGMSTETEPAYAYPEWSPIDRAQLRMYRAEYERWVAAGRPQ